MGDVRIRVLGPLEAEVDGRATDLGGLRQRAVVALLLTARGEVVPVDRLIDDLWSGEPPPRATGALQACISNLCKALEPDRAPRTPARVLISAGPGYAIRLPVGAVDGWEVEDTLRHTPDGAAIPYLAALLSRWRGGAFAEFAQKRRAEPEVARFEELRTVVRERLVSGVPRLRRLRWHARLAEALAAARPSDLFALAYHSVHAAMPATARFAAERAVDAADAADARYAYDTAAALHRQALECLELAEGGTLGERAAVAASLIGTLLIGTLLRAGSTHEASDVRRAAVAEIAAAGDDALLVTVITAWRVPTSWVTRLHGYVDAEFVAVIERLLQSPELTVEQRCLLLHALARETSSSDDPRTEAAAAEMLTFARGLDDPELLGLALSANAHVWLPDLHPERREPFAEVMGVAAPGVVLALEAYSHGIDRAQQLARDYQLGQTIVVGHALFATVILRYLQGRPPELIPDLSAVRGGPLLIRDLLALAHAQGGDLDEARALLQAAPPSVADYLWLIVAAIRGTVAAATGGAELARQWFDALLPYRDPVAGAGSTGHLFVPVAQVLGRIAASIGRPDEAREHLEAPLRIADHCGNALWRASAEAELQAVEGAA